MRAVVVAALLVGCAGEGANGRDGDGGLDGLSALIDLVDEPAGDNCPAGGIAVLAGLDADGNGELSDDEIDSTEYICDGSGPPAVIEGSYVIRNSYDAALLDGVIEVTGTITVEAPGLEVLELPTLERVERIELEQQNVAVVDLPALTDATVYVWQGDPAFSISVPSLQNGELNIQNRPMSTLDVPDGFTGILLVYNLTGLNSLDIPAATMEGISIQEMPDLTTLSAPNLSSVDAGLTIANNPNLCQSAVDALVSGISVTGPSLITPNGPC